MANFEEILKRHIGEDGSLPASAINAAVTAINAAVGNEFVAKDRYKTKLDEIDTLKEKQQTAEDTAATAEKWKTKYDALKGDFETYKTTQTQKESRAQKEAAYRSVLKEAGVSEKRLEAVLKVSDIDAVELADGKIKDADKLTESIKAEWSEFIVSTGERGARVDSPPTTGGEVDTAKMTDAEYFAYQRTKKG